jgi:non-ribosomal peptide synthetase component F
VFAITFGFGEDDAFANQAPFDFDVSAKDLYTTLYCASSLHIVPRVCFAMPKLLAPFMQERGITCCIWAVSALCVVAQLNAFKRERPEQIRLVLFSGEVMPPKHLDKWRSWYPDATFVNLYAPSEVTGNCLYHIVGTGEGSDGRLPLGKPFANCEVMFLGDDMKPIAPGQMGEIYVRCPHLALGYYHDPERTAASFVQNPLNSAWPQTVYKTGDVARLGEDGHYYFAGRKDFQIKHMGHRIELEELELHLNGVDGIERACCGFDTLRNKIVAFYEGDIEAKDIIGALNRKLPKYMIPSQFRKLDALPINARGKIDRQQLLSMLESK